MIKGDKTFPVFRHIFLCMSQALFPSIMTLNSEHDGDMYCHLAFINLVTISRAQVMRIIQQFSFKNKCVYFTMYSVVPAAFNVTLPATRFGLQIFYRSEAPEQGFTVQFRPQTVLPGGCR